MKRSCCLAAAVTILCILLSSLPAGAQENQGELTNRHLITTNPFLILFSWWNVEYEYKIANHSTLGIAGSYTQFEDDEENEDTKYMGGYLIYRFYPSGHAHSGFYFGGRLGMTSVEIDYTDTGLDEKGSAYGFGLDVGYTWLLGDNEHFAISVGAGATRLFGSDLDDDDTGFLPIVRLVNVGAAF